MFFTFLLCFIQTFCLYKFIPTLFSNLRTTFNNETVFTPGLFIYRGLSSAFLSPSVSRLSKKGFGEIMSNILEYKGGIRMSRVIKLLKSLIFYPMLWLRGLFLGVGKFISGFFLLGLILGFLFHAHIGYLIGCGILSFGAFLLTFFYDQILLKLNPTGTTLTLFS